MNNLPTPFDSSSRLPADPGINTSLDGFYEGQDNLTSPIDRFLQLLWRRRWLILAITAGFLVLGIVVSVLSTRIYSATTRIQIDRAAPEVVEVEALNQGLAYDYEFYDTQYELLRSRRLSAKVVDALGLDNEADFLFGNEAAAGDIEQASPEQRRDLAINMVNAATTIEPVPESSIVDIRYNSSSPRYAAAVSNSLAEQYIEMDLEQKFEATARLRSFLETKLAETRERLEESEQEAADYARGRGLVMTNSEEGSGTVNTATLQRLNEELALATATRVRAEAAMRSNRGGQASSRQLDNTAINDLRSRRAVQRSELSKLQSDFGPEYPAVVALQSEIAELDAQISREQGRVGTSVTSQLRDEYSRALQAENALQGRVARAKGLVLNDQQQEIGLKIIQREIDTNRELYDGLLEQFKAVGVAGASSSNRISIVDTAEVPTSPSSPNVPLNIAIALILGLSTSLAVVLLLEQLRNSRLTPEDLTSKLRVPLLGNTPRIENRKGQHVQKSDRAALSEAYYSALTALRFNQEQGLPSSLFVTSSRQYEGKSTSAAALANDLAAMGSKVLLVDIDMRSPSVHKMIGVALDVGVADYLAGREQFKALLHDTQTENFSVMLAGTPPPNPSQLLSNGRLETLLEQAKEHFDYVILDGPPVLGLADAPLIARTVEGTVFVVESNSTPAATARAAIDRLVAVNARIMGALITKYDPKKDGYGYSYGGGYGYGSPYNYGESPT